MDTVHREQIQVGIIDAAVIKVDDRSAVRLCDSLDLRVEISNRISVQIHGGSAGISIQITTLQQGAAVDGSCGIERLYFLKHELISIGEDHNLTFRLNARRGEASQGAASGKVVDAHINDQAQ